MFRIRVMLLIFCILVSVNVFTFKLYANNTIREAILKSNEEQVRINDSRSRWVLGIHFQKGPVHFGLDSEGGNRAETNLLSAPAYLTWDCIKARQTIWVKEKNESWQTSIPVNNLAKDKRGMVTLIISRDGNNLLWRVKYEGTGSLDNLSLTLPISALKAAAVLIPAGLDMKNQGLGPWLLVAPDFGHLFVEADSPITCVAINDGVRRGGGNRAPKGGVNPRLRGQAWLDAVNIPNYKPGELRLQFLCDGSFPSGGTLTLRFQPVEISTPEGIDPIVWQQIRRPYLNNWQPCGTWTTKERTMVLANNALSDPASISLWFYSDPMLFFHKPVPGIGLQHLLKHSLDYWLDNCVSAQGHVNAFGKMYDLYTCTGASLVIAAWDYWIISDDVNWLEKRIPILHRIADYLLRRDVDKDGLIESIHSGNAGVLRDPDRADIWFEMMHFGHKNTWTNLLSYRSFLCLAEMLDAAGQVRGAEYYRLKAQHLRESFVRQLLSKENGWFVSWISQDGKVHDYCHTFINGMAVAYGIVPPDQGRKILQRVVAKSKSIGFECWHLGVPGNLIPCRKEDMIGPRIGIDGNPIKNNFYWQDDLTEEAAFGYRYPNGTIHPPLVWHYILGLQVAGLDKEADRILNAMIESAKEGIFQNGIVNCGYGGAEHFYFNGLTCGYEGFLPESFNFLMGCFTRNPKMMEILLTPMKNLKK